LEQTPAPIERSHQTRAMSPLVYELFRLGELMVEPMYSALLHEIAQRILREKGRLGLPQKHDAAGEIR
jgi:hypothetical protein